MSIDLPLFPLNIVVFPYETLSLHIFEPRYRQLIKDCVEEGITFGIPTYLDDKIKDYGTEVKLLEIVNTYEDGRMDVRTQGIKIFKINSFFNPMPNKLYSGGTIDYVEIADDSTLSERILLVEHLSKMFDILKAEVTVTHQDSYLAYQIGHQVGLSQKQEYHMLTLESESERIHFLIDHLTRTIPIVQEVEKTKARIQMNGHFKHFDPLNF